MNRDPLGIVQARYDHAYVVNTLVTLAQTPTDVPLGQNEIDPTDPKITHYVHRVVRPLFDRLDVGSVEIDDLNNLICRIGTGSSPSLLIMAYTTAQHGNYTDPALEGRILDGRDYGTDGECVIGKGTSQNKGALAATLGALHILAGERARLRGSLTVILNAESQSSHRCSIQLFDGHRIRADAGWLAIGSPGIVLGHRGRVDIHIDIHGAASHSSQPELGANAIWGLHEVLNRLRAFRGTLNRRHPDLGGEQAEPYKLTTSPIAPHTMPAEAHLTLDRRLLPGTSPGEAVEEVRRVIVDVPPYAVTVTKGAFHLPYQVSADLPHIRALAAAYEAVRGDPPESGYVPFAFDAGYPNYRGIPTVMFGPSAGMRRLAGSDVLATELIPISEVRDFTKIYAHTILSLLA